MNDIILFAAIVLIYGLLESLWNVALFRVARTWFPLWDTVDTYSKNEWGQIDYCGNAFGQEMSNHIYDPFHMIKATGTIFILSFMFGILFPIGWWAVMAPTGIWIVYYGVIFPWLYHEFWMTKGNRDLQKQSIVWKYLYFWRM